MIKKAINNVRRMTSHPTLPYCKSIIAIFLRNLKNAFSLKQKICCFCGECLLEIKSSFQNWIKIEKKVPKLIEKSNLM